LQFSTAWSCYAGKEQPRDIPEEESTPNVSEESIAAAFAARYGDRLKFCADFGKWLEWSPETTYGCQTAKIE